MKVYTIAIESNECYGHGDYEVELRIVRMSQNYGSSNFPPLFTTCIAAEEWLKKTNNLFYPTRIVELELLESPKCTTSQ